MKKILSLVLAAGIVATPNIAFAKICFSDEELLAVVIFNRFYGEVGAARFCGKSMGDNEYNVIAESVTEKWKPYTLPHSQKIVTAYRRFYGSRWSYWFGWLKGNAIEVGRIGAEKSYTADNCKKFKIGLNLFNDYPKRTWSISSDR
jgi:hypothetical protein